MAAIEPEAFRIVMDDSGRSLAFCRGLSSENYAYLTDIAIFSGQSVNHNVFHPIAWHLAMTNPFIPLLLVREANFG